MSRLEEIKSRYEWLIERVEELEDIRNTLEDNYEGLWEVYKNLRKKKNSYKEALVFYADEINHQTFIEHGRSNIEHDSGRKARQVLEGDTE